MKRIENNIVETTFTLDNFYKCSQALIFMGGGQWGGGPSLWQYIWWAVPTILSSSGNQTGANTYYIAVESYHVVC